MSNISYCRFENTHNDLMDCYHNMDDDDLSENESRFRERLIKLCVEIALYYWHEVGIDIFEED